MIDKVLELIAISFPYSLEEVRGVHKRLKSIDATILLCEAANHQGITSLWSVMPNEMRDSPKLGDKAICKMCDREIIFDGRWWDHPGELKPRHPAWPKEAA